MPWDIPKLTVFQYYDYLAQIGPIQELFWGSGKDSKAAGSLSTEDKRRLITMAKEKGIRPPKKL